GKTADELRDLIDGAPYSAKQAYEHGLVDALLYEDQFQQHLQHGERLPIIMEFDKARKTMRMPLLRSVGKLVGVVTVEGTIVAGASRNVPLPIPLMGGQMAGADTIIEALRRAERNPRIAAVVLYVNSPGGDAFASDLIWREVLRLQQRKPVVVAMGDVAASGGYYIAAPAAAIVAQPGALTGSIGVFLVRPVIAELLERVGVNTVVLQRGANSSFLAGDQPPTEHERAALRELVATSYAAFKQRVCEGRQLSDEQLEPIAGGRVWSGSEAHEHRLVDLLGGIPEALVKAQELAGIAPDRGAPIIPIRGGRGPIMPQPFPNSATFDALLADALRPRVWAALPYDIE
ncbi:MAG TPA: signal peptide peptidase SppA, partial [Roseiflexaceae bacterium]|nr:signal peptide peptidase SppA [Roseiflexaceae bacterium]